MEKEQQVQEMEEEGKTMGMKIAQCLPVEQDGDGGAMVMMKEMKKMMEVNTPQTMKRGREECQAWEKKCSEERQAPEKQKVRLKTQRKKRQTQK